VKRIKLLIVSVLVIDVSTSRSAVADRARVLSVSEYFGKSLKVIRNGTIP